MELRELEDGRLALEGKQFTGYVSIHKPTGMYRGSVDGWGSQHKNTGGSTGSRVPMAPEKGRNAIGRGPQKTAARVLRRVERRSQVTEDTKTSGRNTWREFLTRWKDPATAVVAIVGIAIVFGTGVIAGAAWFVSPTNAELAELRNQIRTSDKRTETKTATLDNNIGENSGRISDNGERIAHMEAELAGTSGRVDRLYTQVTKNTEVITEVKVRGTPD